MTKAALPPPFYRAGSKCLAEGYMFEICPLWKANDFKMTLKKTLKKTLKVPGRCFSKFCVSLRLDGNTKSFWISHSLDLTARLSLLNVFHSSLLPAVRSEAFWSTEKCGGTHLIWTFSLLRSWNLEKQQQDLWVFPPSFPTSLTDELDIFVTTHC